MSVIIPDWRSAWRYWSVRMYAALLVMPEVWSAAVAAGLVDGSPDVLVNAMRLTALVGLASRLVAQRMPADAAPRE